MRQEVEFRLKSVVVRPLGRTERASSVARRRRSVDVRRSGGPVLNAKPLNVLDQKCSKLGSRISPHIKSAVPPADPCSEAAVAAPSEAHAPIEPCRATLESLAMALPATSTDSQETSESFGLEATNGRALPRPVRIIPRWHSMLHSRHGQALMFCGFAVHQKRSPMQMANQTNRQATTPQTASHTSGIDGWRSEALRTSVPSMQRILARSVGIITARIDKRQSLTSSVGTIPSSARDSRKRRTSLARHRQPSDSA